MASIVPPVQFQAICPTGGVPTTKGVEDTATIAATSGVVHAVAGEGPQPVGMPGIAAAAAIDVVGTKNIVSRPVEPPAGPVKVADI